MGKRAKKDKNFFEILSVRIIICYGLFACLFFLTALRIYDISTTEKLSAAQNSQSLKTQNIMRIRGTVYDTNMLPITNNKRDYFALIPPSPDAVISVSDYLSGSEKESAIKTLKEKKVALCKPDMIIKNENIATTYIYKTDYKNFIFPHIVGYLGENGHGVSGIEAAYDDILYTDKYVKGVYRISGNGQSLLGEKPYFENDIRAVKDGVVLTLDTNIQKAVFEAGNKLKKGAIIIADAKSGKIRALVSTPSYDPQNLSVSLNDKNSPLINRALLSFAVGSVFKPTIAAAAIDNNLSGFSYTCKGRCLLSHRYFYCHKHDGHGTVDLNGALAFSCNTYFYNLAINLGGEKIRKYSSNFNFGNSFDICKNLSVSGGNLTKTDNLTADAQIANFAIGQGDITVSPVGILPLYLSIAGDGGYHIPSIVEATIKNGIKTPYNIGEKTYAMSKVAADKLKTGLRGTVVKGTGTDAASEKVQIAGKTATAQTGKYNRKTEITNSWFCGFFPYDKPQYVGVIFSEGTNEISCGQIFKEIAEKIVKNP